LWEKESEGDRGEERGEQTSFEFDWGQAEIASVWKELETLVSFRGQQCELYHRNDEDGNEVVGDVGDVDDVDVDDVDDVDEDKNGDEDRRGKSRIGRE
jgi:hypothetical protein